MAYADSFDRPSRFGGGVQVDQAEIERILKSLITIQGGSATPAVQRLNRDMSFEGWRKGQVEFAKRLARISAEQARRAEKLRIRHKRISLVRRLALLTMVIAINLPIFL